MNKLYGPFLTVNRNDNQPSSWFRKGEFEEAGEYAAYIPLTNLIIKKHCPRWQKTQPQTSEFQYMQMVICGILYSHKAYGTGGAIQLIASLFECNPIALMNDKELDLLNLPQ